MTESERRKALYHERRAQGMPAWAAWGRSLAGWADRYQANKRWRKKHPEKMRAQTRRQFAKYKELYGGIPRRKFSAHIRWLEARSAKNAARGLKNVALGVSVAEE
jgi:hypothetical protein